MQNQVKNYWKKTMSMKGFVSVSTIYNKFDEKTGKSTAVVMVEWNHDSQLYDMYPSLFHNEKFIGKAALHQEDVADAIHGCDLAEHRAMKGAFNYISAQMRKIAKKVNDLSSNLNDWSVIASEKALKQADIIQSMM